MDNAVIEMKEPLIRVFLKISNELSPYMDKGRGLTIFVRKSHCFRLDFRLGEGRLTSQTTTRCFTFKV